MYYPEGFRREGVWEGDRLQGEVRKYLDNETILEIWLEEGIYQGGAVNQVPTGREPSSTSRRWPPVCRTSQGSSGRESRVGSGRWLGRTGPDIEDSGGMMFLRARKAVSLEKTKL